MTNLHVGYSARYGRKDYSLLLAKPSGFVHAGFAGRADGGTKVPKKNTAIVKSASAQQGSKSTRTAI
jgi:hypothetical protein